MQQPVILDLSLLTKACMRIGKYIAKNPRIHRNAENDEKELKEEETEARISSAHGIACEPFYTCKSQFKRRIISYEFLAAVDETREWRDVDLAGRIPEQNGEKNLEARFSTAKFSAEQRIKHEVFLANPTVVIHENVTAGYFKQRTRKKIEEENEAEKAIGQESS